MVSTTEPAAAVPPPVDPTAPELPPLEVPPPTTTDGKVEGEGNRGDFEIFFEDENNVPSDKQLAYILMMANSYIEGELFVGRSLSLSFFSRPRCVAVEFLPMWT